MLRPGMYDSSQQAFSVTAGVAGSILTVGSFALAREFTVAWWVRLDSVSYNLGSSPRLFRFASASSGYTVQAVMSSGGFWCAAGDSLAHPGSSRVRFALRSLSNVIIC